MSAGQVTAWAIGDVIISDPVAIAVAWILIGAAVLIVLAMYLPLSWWEKLRGRRMPVDETVDVVSDDGPMPGCDCEDCEDEWPDRGPNDCGCNDYKYLPGSRVRVRLHSCIPQHRPDCACDTCWDRQCERLVEGFDWDAAEDDFLRRKPR